MTPANLAILKTELADARYAGLDDVQVKDLLNAQDRQTDADAVDCGKLRSCFVAAEWTQLTQAAKDRLAFLLGSPTLTITAHIRQELRAMFSQGSASRQQIMDAIRRTGSRAEELGLGRVTESDVADARRLS